MSREMTRSHRSHKILGRAMTEGIHGLLNEYGVHHRFAVCLLNDIAGNEGCVREDQLFQTLGYQFQKRSSCRKEDIGVFPVHLLRCPHRGSQDAASDRLNQSEDLREARVQGVKGGRCHPFFDQHPLSDHAEYPGR